MTRPSTANGGFPNVVVTAVTATTSLAGDIESTWKGLLAGESGIRVLEDDFVTKWDLPVKIGGHLADPVDDHMGRLDFRRMSYVQRMAKYVSAHLWESAGKPEVDTERLMVPAGTHQLDIVKRADCGLDPRPELGVILALVVAGSRRGRRLHRQRPPSHAIVRRAANSAASRCSDSRSNGERHSSHLDRRSFDSVIK